MMMYIIIAKCLLSEIIEIVQVHPTFVLKSHTVRSGPTHLPIVLFYCSVIVGLTEVALRLVS
jgi:hypothetical protein